MIRNGAKNVFCVELQINYTTRNLEECIFYTLRHSHSLKKTENKVFSDRVYVWILQVVSEKNIKDV